MKNKLHLKLKIIDKKYPVYIDHVKFINCAIIEFEITNHTKLFDDWEDRSLLVFSELRKTKYDDGCFLIFTASSGIADELDWRGINLSHEKDNIIWKFRFNLKDYYFCFDKSEYITEIKNMEKKLKDLFKGIKLEPTQVFFPEEWEN